MRDLVRYFSEHPAGMIALLVLCGLAVAVAAHGHPGRTDETGCHDVHKNFRYADGREVKAGSRHCHPPTSNHAGTAALTFFGTETFDTSTERSAPPVDLHRKVPPRK
jgi:hypothetical protein